MHTVLTMLLALVYFGIVILLQGLVGALAGIEQSTLAIAALFTPSRRRIQAIIDRRFYRKKYDAQQVLTQFALTARDETDMNALATEQARIVNKTLQPECVEAWLRQEISFSSRNRSQEYNHAMKTQTFIDRDSLCYTGCMKQKARYVWDYNITQEQFDALLDGRIVEGHLDRDWAAVRLIEWAPYREMIQRLGYQGLVEGWPAWRDRLRSEQQRRALDFLVAWLPGHHPELLQQQDNPQDKDAGR